VRGNIVVRLLYRLILLFMIVGSVQGWGGGGQLWSVVEVECGRGLAMSHILGKMSYSHKYLNVLNLLNVFTLGPDLKTTHDGVYDTRY
jgi:hypothetical protein